MKSHKPLVLNGIFEGKITDLYEIMKESNSSLLVEVAAQVASLSQHMLNTKNAPPPETSEQVESFDEALIKGLTAIERKCSENELINSSAF